MTRENVEAVINDVLVQYSLKKKDFLPWVRFALSGQLHGYDVVDLILLWGPEKSAEYIKNFAEAYRKRFNED